MLAATASCAGSLLAQCTSAPCAKSNEKRFGGYLCRSTALHFQNDQWLVGVSLDELLRLLQNLKEQREVRLRNAGDGSGERKGKLLSNAKRCIFCVAENRKTQAACQA